MGSGVSFDQKDDAKRVMYLDDILSVDYLILIRKANKIKKHDLVLNAGLTDEVTNNIKKGKLLSAFLKTIYGIYINADIEENTELSALYANAINQSKNKSGIGRAIAIADSIYQQLFFRMAEYSDIYGMYKGISTPLDMNYMEKYGSRHGKLFNLTSVISEGPFYCHEFAVTLYAMLEREKRRTGFEPFYVMGKVKKGDDSGMHAWIELGDKTGKRFILDEISHVLEFIPHPDIAEFTSKSGINYLRDNGPVIIRNLKID